MLQNIKLPPAFMQFMWMTVSMSSTGMMRILWHLKQRQLDSITKAILEYCHHYKEIQPFSSVHPL